MNRIRKRLGIWLLRSYLLERLMFNTLLHVEDSNSALSERYWMGRISEVDAIIHGREVRKY